MTWVQLSLKEWRRRPLRTGATAAGVGIATAALYSLLAFQSGFQEELGRELDQLGAHVLLAPKGCPYDAASMALHGANWPCYLKGEYLQEVRSVPGVAAAAPVFMAAVHGSHEAEQTVYVGVETNILALRPAWRISGRFPAQDGEVLAGSEVARRSGWALGSRVELPGVPSRSARLAGILEPTHGPDDTFIYLKLPDAQRAFCHTNELTHILIRLTDSSALDQVVAQLRGCGAGLAMNVVPLAQVFRTIQSLANSTRLLLGCLAAVALLIAGTGVTNTLLMALTERAREIGIMRAVGALPANIFCLILLETLQVCFIGATLGILAALLGSSVIEAWLRSELPFAPTEAMIRWNWPVSAGCLTCSMALGSIAGFLPAWYAAHWPPVVAIRAAGGRI